MPSKYYYKPDLRPPYQNELFHHGVKGQKWGVRRYQNLDGSLTAEGRRHYGYGEGRNKAKVGMKDIGGYGTAISSKISLNDDIDPAIVYGGVYVAAMAACAAPAIVAAAKQKTTVKRSVKLQEKCEEERANAPIDPKTKLKVQEPPKSFKENLARVNPAFNEARYSDDRKYRYDYTCNCASCAITMELRTRGFEVQAVSASAKYNANYDNAEYYYKKAKAIPVVKDIRREIAEREKTKNPVTDAECAKWLATAEQKRMHGNKELIQKVHSAMAKEPVGSRGKVSVFWGVYGGHAMAYEILGNGKFRLIDAQTGKYYDGQKANQIIKNALSFEYTRTDNLEIDFKKIKEIIQ